jgi:hypothetical protein
MVKERRKLTPNEVLKERAALDALHSFTYAMSPHQLDLLANFVWKIIISQELKDK